MNRTVKSVHESKTSQIGSGKTPSPLNSQPSSLYLCVISAPSSEAREQVSHHLRYWPYVKFFKYQGDRHLLCCFCLGEAKDGYQLKQLYERSRQLVLLCLRQYDVTITRWKPLPTDFRLFHNNKLFTRPEASVRPFISFMGDSGSVSSSSTSEATKSMTKFQVPSGGSGYLNAEGVASDKRERSGKPETTAKSMKHETKIIPHPASVNKKIPSTLNWIKALFFRFPKLSSLNPHPSTL